MFSSHHSCLFFVFCRSCCNSYSNWKRLIHCKIFWQDTLQLLLPIAAVHSWQAEHLQEPCWLPLPLFASWLLLLLLSFFSTAGSIAGAMFSSHRCCLVFLFLQEPSQYLQQFKMANSLQEILAGYVAAAVANSSTPFITRWAFCRSHVGCHCHRLLLDCYCCCFLFFFPLQDPLQEPSF